MLIGIGLWVRLRVLESPEFRELERREAGRTAAGLVEAIRKHPREILTSAFVRLSEQAPFYIFITFVLTYGTTELELSRGELLTDTLVAAAIGLISVPLFGHLSDRSGDAWCTASASCASRCSPSPTSRCSTRRSSGLVLVAIVVSLIVHDIQYGPQAALIAESFGTNVRYSGAGLGYQLASVIAGGPAPLIAAAIIQRTGSSTGISWYIIACCVVAFGALVLMPRRPEAATADRPEAARTAS